MTTKIYNGKILIENGSWIENGSVVIENGHIREVSYRCDFSVPCDISLDAEGGYVVPGGIDMHVHGAGDHDFMEGTSEAFETIIKIHRQHGTTCMLPTVASSTIEQMTRSAMTCTKLMENPKSGILGLHFEGPYFNPLKVGGQAGEHIRNPVEDEYHSLVEHFPCIKRWDAAPEMPGALKFADFLTKHGIIAGIAHTAADYEQIERAFESGYTLATHFYNAMTSTHNEGLYKHEGTVESILLTDSIDIEIIGDGIHVPGPLVRLAHKVKGTERMCLVSDALAITACEGVSTFDPRVIIENGVCRLKDGSALAGSCATMDKMIKAMVTQAKLSVSDVFRMSAETPSRILGINDRKGSISVLKDADICIYDKNLNLKNVIAMGDIII